MKKYFPFEIPERVKDSPLFSRTLHGGLKTQVVNIYINVISLVAYMLTCVHATQTPSHPAQYLLHKNLFFIGNKHPVFQLYRVEASGIQYSVKFQIQCSTFML